MPPSTTITSTLAEECQPSICGATKPNCAAEEAGDGRNHGGDHEGREPDAEHRKAQRESASLIVPCGRQSMAEGRPNNGLDQQCCANEASQGDVIEGP